VRSIVPMLGCRERRIIIIIIIIMITLVVEKKECMHVAAINIKYIYILYTR